MFGLGHSVVRGYSIFVAQEHILGDDFKQFIYISLVFIQVQIFN
jgi:hypothetical protein